MEVIRLLKKDDTLESLDKDWEAQCDQIGEDFADYAPAPLSMIRALGDNSNPKQWAIGLSDEGRFMAAACAILARQKGFIGPVLRIREVAVCPLLDYGDLDENTYVDTLIGLLNGALKLSESKLKAEHIKLHLRSPADAVFFRAFGKTLDSRGVFASIEAHGAWLTFSKSPPLQIVK